jgi:hypothetical protein
MTKTLRRFWFEFEKSAIPTPLNIGCGVTAYDVDDARQLLEERVFPREKVRKIMNCQADIDVSTLDKNHVLPNMGSAANRGVWFPLGF